MSGGSFDYLYCAELSPGRLGDVERMAARLDDLGHSAAAKDTRTVAAHLRLAEKGQGGLAEVWRCVEWLVSCDYGEDQVADAVAKWEADRG